MNHLVSSAYIELILRANWLPAEQLFQNTSLTPERLSNTDYVQANDVAQLFINLDKALNVPDWPLLLGNQFGLTAHGPLGFAALTAATLGDALKVFVDFHAVRVTALEMAFHEHTDTVFVQVRDNLNPPIVAQRMEQLVLKILESLLETILGHSVSENVKIRLAMPTPMYAELLTSGYHAALLFDQPCSGISLPKAWAALPSPLHDENSFRLHSRQCRDIINRIVDPKDLLGRVERLLDDYFDTSLQSHAEISDLPTLESIAAQLFISPRTLIRHLRQKNCHFRGLVETRRKEAAQQLLRRPGMRINDIALRLGYSEVANFSRAFKAWFGCSPHQWRQKI